MRLNGGDRRWPVLVTIDHFQSRYRSDLYGILAETRETAAGGTHVLLSIGFGVGRE